MENGNRSTTFTNVEIPEFTPYLPVQQDPEPTPEPQYSYLRCIQTTQGSTFEVNAIYRHDGTCLLFKDGSKLYENINYFLYNLNGISFEYTTKEFYEQYAADPEKYIESQNNYIKCITSQRDFIKKEGIYKHNGFYLIVDDYKTLHFPLVNFTQCGGFGKFELSTKEEYEAYNDTTNEEVLKRNFTRYLQEQSKLELQNIEKEYIHKLCEYDELKSTLRKECNAINKLKHQIEVMRNQNIYKDNVIEELFKIKKHKLCKTLEFTNSDIIINTHPLFIIEPNTWRHYALGEMKIIIPLNNSRSIQIFNLTTQRRGYSPNMHHPHIFEAGDPCWGTADSQIAIYKTQKEYFALYLTILSFCQTVDIDDCAGWFVSCWDQIDDDISDGFKIIKTGHRPSDSEEYDGYGQPEGQEDDEGLVYCLECDLAMEEDDALYCEHCGDYFCNRHAEYYYDINRTLCHTCRNEHYTYCEECGRLINLNDAEYLEDDEDTPFCHNCYITVEENERREREEEENETDIF